MAHARLGGRVQQTVGHRVTGDGLQGQRGDELLGGAGHHHPYLGALIFQAAYQLGTLVGGDPATDTQQDAFIGQSHLLFLFRLTLTGRLRYHRQQSTTEADMGVLWPGSRDFFAMFSLNSAKERQMSIKEWPEDERPREKLLRHGPGGLSDAELLAIFLRTGVSGLSAVDLSRNLLNQFGSLRNLLGADRRAFCEAHGLGPAKYAQLQAVLEMGKRHLAQQLQRGDALTSPQLTRDYLQAQLRDRPREVFALLLLDNQHRVIQFVELFYGTLDSASVWPREIVQIALKHNAAAVILAHNHPSGVAEPSRADRQITDRITAALALIDIRVLDHLVIGDGITVSFAERGWL